MKNILLTDAEKKQVRVSEGLYWHLMPDLQNLISKRDSFWRLMCQSESKYTVCCWLNLYRETANLIFNAYPEVSI